MVLATVWEPMIPNFLHKFVPNYQRNKETEETITYESEKNLQIAFKYELGFRKGHNRCEEEQWKRATV